MSQRLRSCEQQNEKFRFHGVFLFGGMIFLVDGEAALVPVFTGSGDLLGALRGAFGVSVVVLGAAAAGGFAVDAVEEEAVDFAEGLR